MRIARRLFATFVVFTLAGPVVAADRTADEIVKEIEAVPRPKTRAEVAGYGSKLTGLIAELHKAHPDDARLKTLLLQRWMVLASTDKSDEALAEIEKVLATTKDEALKQNAAFARAQIELRKGPAGIDRALKSIDEFAKLAPGDRRVPALLYSVSMSLTDDPARKTALEDRLLKDFGDSMYGSLIKGLRRQRAAIGKPFDLEFTEAIKGTNISIKALKGKVVVIDFWATWCGPCVAEMPTMKSLYAEYKDKGVEFIGVSLDQPKDEGGLDKLKKFVAEKEIAWPQYYQGNGWDSEFSKAWGVNGIPCVFIVDADGKLYSTEARGKLPKLIPELLKKAKPDHTSG